MAAASPMRSAESRTTRRVSNFVNSDIPVRGGNSSFFGGRDILSACVAKHIFGAIHHHGIAAMNGQEDTAVTDSTFIPFRFIFGDAHADESARKATDDGPGAQTG